MKTVKENYTKIAPKIEALSQKVKADQKSNQAEFISLGQTTQQN